MEGEKDQSKLTNREESPLPPSLSNDLDLVFEQEFAKLTQQHENLKKKYADQLTTNERLQINKEEDKSRMANLELQIEQLTGSNSEEQTSYIQNLRNQLREQEDLIARQEAQVEENRVNKQRHEKELSSLRPLAQRLQEVQDEMKELQISNSALTKKANMVDRYQEKLERAKDLERDIARLREHNETLQNNQISFDRVHEHNSRLEAETEAYRQKMQQYELELSEHRERRQHLEHEMRTKEAIIDGLKSKQTHDEQFIEELQEQLQTRDVPLSPDSPSSKAGGLSLGAELEQSESQHPNLALEISRLKAENQLLKSNTAGTTNATLRVDLDEAEHLTKRLKTQILELTEKHAISQEQLNALLSTSTGEKLVTLSDQLMKLGPLHLLTEGYHRNEAISSTRKLWLDATKELSATKNKLDGLQLALTKSDRELLAAKAERKPIRAVLTLFLLTHTSKCHG
jgi:protein HOOK3